MSRRYNWGTFKNSVPSQFRKSDCRPFDMEIPTEVGFTAAGKARKILVVIGKMTTDDLSSAGLLRGEFANGMRIMETVIDEATRQAQLLSEKVKPARYAFINFNYFKNYTLSNEQYESSLRKKRKRIEAYIEKMEPDAIVVFGLEAAKAMLPREQNLDNRSGTIFKFNGLPTITLPEWDRMIPAQGETGRVQIDKAGLLGFASRTFAHILLKKHPFSLAHIKPKPKLVKTTKGVRKMLARLRKHKAVAVDTETANLTVLDNKLLTVQFAYNTKSSYVVPVDHKDNPMNARSIAKTKAMLRKFFMEEHHYAGEDTKYLVMHNGKFDIRILRHQLDIPYMYWPIWDTIAGEFTLDEHTAGLAMLSKDSTAWGLAGMLARYDNNWYYEAAFGKKDRKTIAAVPLSKEVLNYCGMDVQATLGLHLMQQARAAMMIHEGKPYYNRHRRLVLVQMSNNIHMMSSMVRRGNPLDISHLMYIAGKNSPINALIKETMDKLRDSKAVKKANKLLVREHGVPKRGLFGKVKDPWLFDLGIEHHKQLLYIDVLGLEPVEVGSSGRAKLDKYFQAKHKEVAEVQVLTRKNKLSILRNTFAKGILKKASQSPDVKRDRRLRPDYDFQGVLTGRSNSSNPSLQQIPEHSGEAKIIKHMFTHTPGTIQIKMDYSSHEVRGWGFIGNDEQVAASFQQINDLIARYRKKLTFKAMKKMVDGGDIHKINYSMFTGVPVGKVTKEQRQAAKAIVFGALYGMSAKSLAESLGLSEEEAQKLIDKFMSKAKRASKWLKFTAENASERYYAFSPLGRRRNLFAYMTGMRRVASGCGRRAQNAPIQGMSSDFVFDAARLMEEGIYRTFLHMGKIGKKESMPSAGVMRMVHDSIQLEMNYRDFLIILWIVEYCSVYGLRKMLEETFKFKLNVDFAIDVEVGSVGDKFEKWSWHPGDVDNRILEEKGDVRYGLKNLIKMSLDYNKKHGEPDLNIKRTMKEMYAEGEKARKYLRKHFPLPFEPF